MTGTKAFDGKTLPDVVAAVLANEPDWVRLDGDLPWRVRDLLMRSLRKDSRRRVSSISAVRLDLVDCLGEGARVEPATKGARTHWVPFALSAVALAASIFIWGSRGRVATGGEVSRFVIELPRDRTLSTLGPRHMALSSNGRRLVYTGVENGKSQLYLRTMDAVDERRLPGTADALNPFFSFDGRELLFDTRAGTLLRIRIDGERPMEVADRASFGAGFRPTGAIVFTRRNSLWGSSEEGGAPERLHHDESAQLLALPEFLPSGHAVLYSRWSGSSLPSVHAFTMRTGETRKLLDAALAASYVESGHLVFLDMKHRALSAIAFDAEQIRVTGQRVRVHERVERAVNGAISFAVSRSGNLVYRSGGEASRLVWVDRSGRATPVDSDARLYNRPRVSPDMSRIAVAVTDERGRDIWIRELASGAFSKLTFSEADETAPVWSPDGADVVFASDRSGVWMAYAKPADGTGDPRLLTDRLETIPSSFSPDGNVTAFMSNSGSLGFLRLHP